MAPPVIDIVIDFPVARPKLKGGGSDVEVNFECRQCKRKEKRIVFIKCHGEKRLFGCRKCKRQVEREVQPKRVSHI